MSFILDALKKSESERQRQSGPALFEVKIAPPRNRFAIWALALGALLAVNLLVVGWLFWRGGGRAIPIAPATTPQASAPAYPVAAAAGAPRAEARAPADAQPTVRAPQPDRARPDQQVGAVAQADAGAPGTNPDDLAPAVDPSRGASPQQASTPASGGAGPRDISPRDVGSQTAQPFDGVIRATASGLPTYQDAASQPGANFPDLRLDLHVWSAQPDQRFVFLNMTRLREGDELPKGVRVERITPDGVILSYHGKEFVLLKPTGTR